MSWPKGKSEDAETVILEVSVRRDKYGRVVSAHAPQDAEDQALLESWPSGGMEQVAFALLSEAVRREALLDVLLNASHNPNFLSAWQEMSEDGKKIYIQKLTHDVQDSMNVVIGRLAGSALRTALDLVSTPKPEEDRG